MTVPGHMRRTVAVAIASVGLAAGCGDAGLIDDSSAAAAPGEVVDTTIVSGSVALESPATTASAPETSSAADPGLPALDDVLAEEQFVPLAIALERSGLDEVIAGLDDFVLLAPTESAFASAGTDVGIDYMKLVTSPRLLEAVIRYHIVADPLTNVSWRTLNGALLDVAPNKRVVDGVEVLDRIPVRNGVVLVMPRVLLPASDTDTSQP
jgi:uncharacterized surface protein with fasciclin (FAS1) repeats